MGEFDHVPTPDASEVQKMFEADGGVEAEAEQVLNEDAAKRNVEAHQRQAADLEAARANLEQAAQQAPPEHADHLRAVGRHRELTSYGQIDETRLRPDAGHAAEAGDTQVVTPPRPAESREEVIRAVFQKQLPSAWTPEAKKLAARQAKQEAKESREPLHRRAGRFIKAQFQRGRHSR